MPVANTITKDARPEFRTIMVVGLPRSGTTWLGKIFDSHPETFYSHEPDSASPFRDIPLLLPIDSTERYRHELERQIGAFHELRSLRVVGKLPLFPKSYLPRIPEIARTTGFYLLKSISRFHLEPPVPRLLTGTPDDASAWVWKSIESLGRLGALARTLPNAKAIFLVRHPCGVIASLLKGGAGMEFQSGPASEDRGFFELLSGTKEARSHGLGLSHFDKMSGLERLAWRWALMNEKAMRESEGVDRIRLLRYEDLCRDPLAISRDLFKHVGLDWHPQTERFVRASTSQSDDAYYGVFKNPAISANKWRHQLDPSTVDGIMEIVGGTEPGRLYSGSDGVGASDVAPA